jgi:hypothetical protein
VAKDAAEATAKLVPLQRKAKADKARKAKKKQAASKKKPQARKSGI